MKKIILIISLSIFTSLKSQDWKSKEIEIGIFVDFPNEPMYKVNTIDEMIRNVFISEINGCMLIATVNHNIIPIQKFSRIKFTTKTSKIMSSSFFSNYIKEAETLYGVDIREYPEINGNINGYKFSHPMLNPINGQKQLSLVYLFYIPERNISIEFRTLCNDQKELLNHFFNSIKFLTK